MPTKLEPLRGKRVRRLTRSTNRKNVADDAGTVRVSVILLDPKRGQHQRGNVTRHFHLSNVRVSEVAHSLERWLFTGGANTAIPHITL